MSTLRTNSGQQPPDPLIEEVRENRRSLMEEFGNDLDRLGAHLRKVHAEYEGRTGPFAALPREPEGELFPAMNKPVADPIIDEVRAVRRSIAEERAVEPGREK